MGIDVHNLRALCVAARLFEVNFKTSIMLGRQGIHCPEHHARRIIATVMRDRPFAVPEIGTFAEGLFRTLGAEVIDSIDATDFEQATIVSDFCKPMPEQYKERYSFYCDFGTIEHIFNVPQALANISQLLQPGGHALIVTNSNGFIGHGFYQFSPEFFYSSFSEQNGFRDANVFLVDIGKHGEWLHVRDPRKSGVRSRCGLIPECYVVCIAQKVAACDAFQVNQSDYENFLWQRPVEASVAASNKASRPPLILRYSRLREFALFMRRTIGVRGADLMRIPNPDYIEKGEFFTLVSGH